MLFLNLSHVKDKTVTAAFKPAVSWNEFRARPLDLQNNGCRTRSQNGSEFFRALISADERSIHLVPVWNIKQL